MVRAVTWTAAGSPLFIDSGNLPVSNVAIGNLLLVIVDNYTNSTVWCSGLSGGGATWTPIGTKFAGVTNTGYLTAFAGTVTATGAGTVTPTWSGTAPAGFEINGHEFSSSAGSWSWDQQGTLDSSVTNAPWPSFTAAAGELYFAFAGFGGTYNAGTTSGYVYPPKNTDGDGTVFSVAYPSGTFPAWVYTAGSANQFGLAVLMKEPTGILAVAATGTGAALSPSITTSTVTVGPKYAGTAADLGGVYGSWGTPQFATGGP